MELTKEQIEALQKDNEALKAKVTELEKDGGNADAARARKTIDDLKSKNEDLTKKVSTFEKEKADAEKAKLSETERLKAEKEEAENKAKIAEEGLARTQKETAFKFAVLQAGGTNVDDAVKLADLSKFDPSNADSSKAFVEVFKKEKAFLFGAGGTPAQVGTRNGDPNPENGSQEEKKKQEVEAAVKTRDSLKVLEALSKK